MDFKRTIVFDLDDTISRTFNRDFENSQPIIPVIKKINRLYAEGWHIIILTARGQVSCQGDILKREKKYRAQIEKWLNWHDVKYHELSFQKPLAMYYVDDKALTPEQFVILPMFDLGGGRSGATIERHGDRVVKTHDNSLEAMVWFKIAKQAGIPIPEIYSIVDKTITMEYIEHEKQVPPITDVLALIEYLSYVEVQGIKDNHFETYINRIKAHCVHNDNFYEIIPLLEEIEDFCNEFKTFSHGDFSLENLLVRDRIIYLIDPIYNKDLYSSYLLDYAKYLHSLRRNKLMDDYNQFLGALKYLGYNERILFILEISQWVRIMKYVEDIVEYGEYKDIIHNLIKRLT